MADEEIKHFISNRFGAKGISEVFVEQLNADSQSEVREKFEQTIDLRNIYPYSCSPVYYGDRIHYMDSGTTDYYQMLLERNDGRYTEKIYNSVMKYASANVPPDPDADGDLASTHPQVIPAGYSQNRQEGRLNFATDVEIEMPSGVLVMSRSVDISPSGIQLKVKQLLDVVDGMELLLRFPDLELKHEQLFGPIPYVLKKHTIGSLHMSLYMIRKEPGEHPFDIFLEGFIKAKKHRYRIDAEDSLLALVSKAWEYLYIKALPYVACFVSTAKERIQIQEIAISTANQIQLSGLGQSMLSQLEKHLTSIRLKGIADQKELAPEMYSFRYRGDGIRRKLSACSWQFKDSAHRVKFLQVGIQQDTFTAWSINAVRLENLPEVRSHELLSQLQQHSGEQADNLIAEFNQFGYLLYLTDITEAVLNDPILSMEEPIDHVPDQFFDDYEMRHSSTSDYTRLRLGITKRRNEQRYIYESPVVMKLYGVKYKGTTEDFSINGLKVRTKKYKHFQIRDTVYLEFKGFNRKFRSAKLKSEPYRVVAITPDGAVCLCRDHRVSQHKAAIFLSKLISKNADILKHCTGEIWMSTKARLIEAWMHQCLPTQSLLVARQRNQYSVPYIIESDTSAEVLEPFASNSEVFDFSALFDRKEITGLFRHLKIQLEHVNCLEIYVSQAGDATDDVELRLWSDFETDLDRVEYIKSKYKSPGFAAYTLSLTAVPKLDKTSLGEELAVLRKNSRHRLVEFENTYHSLVGVLELMLTTDKVTERYNLK